MRFDSLGQDKFCLIPFLTNFSDAKKLKFDLCLNSHSGKIKYGHLYFNQREEAYSCLKGKYGNHYGRRIYSFQIFRSLTFSLLVMFNTAMDFTIKDSN